MHGLMVQLDRLSTDQLQFLIALRIEAQMALRESEAAWWLSVVAQPMYDASEQQDLDLSGCWTTITNTSDR
eukprot:9112229-Prorocentrum_lima.AAC.1